MSFHLSLPDVQRLYGEKIFIIPEKGAKNPQIPTDGQGPSILWRPKPNSRVLFVIHEAEMKNRNLTDLLKKIVESIGIPFEAAGFGVLRTKPSPADFEGMPNPWAVIFDHDMNPHGDNPWKIAPGTVVFAHTLTQLSQNLDFKKALWEHLKQIKEALS